MHRKHDGGGPGLGLLLLIPAAVIIAKGAHRHAAMDAAFGPGPGRVWPRIGGRWPQVRSSLALLGRRRGGRRGRDLPAPAQDRADSRGLAHPGPPGARTDGARDSLIGPAGATGSETA